MNEDAKIFGVIGGICVLLVVGIASLFLIAPVYSVWQQGMRGQASLKRAEQEKKILVEQATAERDAARIEAEAIALLGQAAKDYPEYRQQKFIGGFEEAMRNGDIQKIIYVPTEANIPIVRVSSDD